ncbi:MAG: glycosyltransferase family 39 protein [Candidatus Eremiobacteraeota bacterium]|nr:glycosyltransferase family 39 protein [Candidatus Eremiobacteraeota bacterium]
MRFFSLVFHTMMARKVFQLFTSWKERIARNPYPVIFVVLVALFTALRMACAMRLPLSGDEAYYYLWSKIPASGYYDHPPMIAWFIALSTMMGSREVLMIRMSSVGAAFLYSLFFYFTARHLTGSDKTAFLAGLFFLLIPYLAIDSTMVTPNGPLIFFWSLYLFLLVRALASGNSTDWFLSGLALGGALLSKLMAFFLPLSLLLFLFLSKRHRPQLARKGFYLSMAGALLLFSPFLIWNSLHHWENFDFQLVARHHFPLSPDPASFANFLLMQAFSLSPFFFFFSLFALFRSLLAGVREGRDDHLFCASFSLPIFLFFFSVSMFEHVEMYWPIAGALTATISAALLVEEIFTRQAPGVMKYVGKGFIMLMCAVLLALTGLLYFCALSPKSLMALCAKTSPVGEAQDRGNGLIEMYAYEDLAGHLRELQKARGGPEKVFIMTDNYSLSSALTYYMGDYVHIYSPWNLQGREYQKWENYRGLEGMDAIYVDRFPTYERENMVELFSQNFESVTSSEALEMKKHGKTVKIFYLTFCRSFKGTITCKACRRLPRRGAPGFS